MSTVYDMPGVDPGRRFPRGAGCQWQHQPTFNVSLRQAAAAATWAEDAHAAFPPHTEVRCDRCEDLIGVEGVWRGRASNRKWYDICAPCYEWMQHHVDVDYVADPTDPKNWWLTPPAQG